MGCAAAAGAVLGFLSVYVVLRRMIFVSAAVSQCAGLGVAFAFWAEIYLGLHVPPVVSAGLAAVGVTLLLAVEPRRLGLTREGTLGLAYALGAGAAVLLGDRIAQEAHDVQAILFGTAVLVRPVDLWAVVGVGAASLGLHLWWYRSLTFASFDEVAARVQGVPVGLL
jgi:zinc transport system permease protein